MWPMWAALLGLIEVCSTITCPGRVFGLRSRREALVQLPREGTAVQEQVDVAASGHLRAHDARSRAEQGRELRRDLARLAAERLGEIERGREREVAQVDARGILEGDLALLDAEGGANGLTNGGGKPLLDLENHDQ